MSVVTHICPWIFKIAYIAPCNLRTNLKVVFRLVITDICLCAEFVNYGHNAFITQATDCNIFWVFFTFDDHFLINETYFTCTWLLRFNTRPLHTRPTATTSSYWLAYWAIASFAIFPMTNDLTGWRAVSHWTGLVHLTGHHVIQYIFHCTAVRKIALRIKNELVWIFWLFGGMEKCWKLIFYN
jgi:hypothetical protein